jgi:hypothetical protein
MAKAKIKTPLGELRWVYVEGDGRDQSAEQDGSKMQKMASIVFKKDSPEAKNLIAQIDKVWEAFKAENPTKIKPATKPKSLGYKPVLDKDTGEETGELIFNFKTNSFFPNGKPNNVVIYNAKGQKVNLGDTGIGNGSIGIIFGEAAGYEYAKQYGISLYLKGIQLKKLVEKSTEGIDDSDLEDLGEDEDSFIATDEAVPEIADI